MVMTLLSCIAWLQLFLPRETFGVKIKFPMGQNVDQRKHYNLTICGNQENVNPFFNNSKTYSFDKRIVFACDEMTIFVPRYKYNTSMNTCSNRIVFTIRRMIDMDEQFIKRLHSLNRRDSLRSLLLIEGVRLTLRRKKQVSFFKKLFHRKKLTVTARGWK